MAFLLWEGFLLLESQGLPCPALPYTRVLIPHPSLPEGQEVLLCGKGFKAVLGLHSIAFWLACGLGANCFTSEPPLVHL